MLVNGKKFPLRKFYKFAERNGWHTAAQKIKERTWTAAAKKKRSNTAMRRIAALDEFFADKKDALVEFTRRYWI
jgi:hypothetical protein